MMKKVLFYSFYNDFNRFRPCERMRKHAFSGRNTQQSPTFSICLDDESRVGTPLRRYLISVIMLILKYLFYFCQVLEVENAFLLKMLQMKMAKTQKKMKYLEQAIHQVCIYHHTVRIWIKPFKKWTHSNTVGI